MRDGTETPPATTTAPPAEPTPGDVLLAQAAAAFKANDPDTAADLCREVLRADPGNPDGLQLLGMTHHAFGDHRTAIRLMSRSAAISPYELTYHNLGIAALACGELDLAVAAHRQAMRLEPDYAAAAANLIFALDHHPGTTPELLLEERRAFNARFCAPLTRQVVGHANSRDPNRRLKVGYVSGDFKLHSASMSFGPVILQHDPRQVALYLYSTPGDARRDVVTEALEAKADVWTDCGDLSDVELADRIRADGIDILVDLSAYSSRGRLLTFARKPAPVQVTAWGYATGTGLDAMDYLVADAVSVPPECERYYTEKILRLPCLVAFEPGDPERSRPPIEGLPSARTGVVTFGYLGRSVKLNGALLAAWARIMRRVPDSRLLLKGDDYCRDQVLRERISYALLALGVGPERLVLLPSTTVYDHRATYNQVDIALDSFPAGSGTTALEASLMGVPMVAKLGERIPERQAAAILTHVGIAPAGTTVDEYVERAVAWANDREALATYRRTLRDRLLGSVICDAPGYARLWERKLRECWRAWCSEQARRERAA